jgi:hypothetical protein
LSSLSDQTERRVFSGFRARSENGAAVEMRAQRLAFQCQELSRQLIRLRVAVSTYLRATHPDERKEAKDGLRYEMARVGQFAEEPKA